MKERSLGRNGPKVGEIALGCMSFGGMYGPTDEATSHRTLARAAELGVTHLDTANIYGRGVSESFIGSYIRASGNPFTIATKASIHRPKDGPAGPRNDAPHLRAELEKSLRRLGLDHVPLFYIHRREQSRPVEEVIETLLKFRDEGLIGAIGFSEIAPSTLRRAAAIGPVAAVQSEYSLWTRNADLGLIRACNEVGAAFVPFSPVARGMFASTPPTRADFADGDIRRNNPRFTEPNFSRNLEYFARFRQLAADLGTSPITLALAWVLARDDNLIPIPGTRTPEHLEECAAASDFAWSDEIATEIDRIMPPGFAHGDRYSTTLINDVERYC